MLQDETGDRAAWSTAGGSTPLAAIAKELIAHRRCLLDRFASQDFALRSITLVDADPEQQHLLAAQVFRIGAARPPRSVRPLLDLAVEGTLTADVLRELHDRVQEIGGGSSGDDLLVAPAKILNAVVPGAGGGYQFRAVAATMTGAAMRHELDLSLRRNLFDAGLVGIGRVALASVTLDMVLASDAVRSPEFLDGGERGQIGMSSLGTNGRFGNQLFQYAFLKLYALRHGVRMVVPDWPGRKLFGLKDLSSGRVKLPQLAFQGFSEAEPALWDAADPPINVDFWGYFQETPPCWRSHRALLRTLFALPAKEAKALDEWCSQLTCNGQRTLVAIHVRRTDYAQVALPHFQMIPERWYVDWLREIWPTLSDPLLFVATDDPDNVLRHFAEFSPKSLADLPRSRLPDHVRDFEVLRRADCLAICNSSFSRMAAILAGETQRCFLPSTIERCMIPYEPWSDGQFWARFENAASDPWSVEPIRTGADRPGRIVEDHGARNVYVDVTDLLFHLRSHSTVSGIQRVQCELIRNLMEETQGAEVNFTVFGRKGLAVVTMPALLGIIARLDGDPVSMSDFPEQIRAALDSASPALAKPGDLFLATGAFWAVEGVGRQVWLLKEAGLTVGLFVHDILPISRPEFFEANSGRTLVKPVVEVLALADFIVTSSHYNKAALAAYRKARNLPAIPMDVVPLGHGLSKPSTDTVDFGDAITKLLESEFVLCVGTIETRKNPSYLFNIWKLMVEKGGDRIPTLVLAGRKGWLVEDFLGQLKASDNLDGRIVLLHDLSDQTLHMLYRKCLLTMFPSFDEGWGLPVGESLAHGKICLASRTGGVPEVGGGCADYIDPYNVRDGYEQLVRYLDDPGLRTLREREIAEQFSMRSWQSYAAGIMLSVRANLERTPVATGAAAIALPANKFLAIGKRIEGSSQEAVRGDLSAEVACVSGWSAPADVGIAAFGPLSVLRFRADRATWAKVTLILRFSTSGSRPVGFHLRPEFGARQSVTIKPGPDVVATISCESGEDGLVTIFFESAESREPGWVDRSLWKLKGFLYFQPSALAAVAPTTALGKHSLNAGGSQARKVSNALIKAAVSSAASRDVDSLAAFLAVPNSNWHRSGGTTVYRREPIFVDSDDRRLFMARYRNSRSAQLGAVRDDIIFRRRGNQYVSMSRFTEGAVFDASGVAKDLGYIKGATDDPPWVARHQNGCWIDAEAFAQARHLDGAFAIFFNGNLHNYYHWVAEGLLALDVLTQTLGESSGLRIVLPQTMDINAVLDHRASLRALGFDALTVIEASPQMVHVDDALWVDSRDFIEGIPASDVQRFQRRVASLYADRRMRKRRRLLVKRLGAARAIGNFDQVEEFLHPLGFETVWLEGASIEEQAMMFQNAEFVVAAHGAGLTNLLFCEPGTKVIEFMPTVEMRPFFWLISEKLRLRHAMQFCPGVEGEGFQASIRVDIGRLRELYDLVDSDR